MFDKTTVYEKTNDEKISDILIDKSIHESKNHDFHKYRSTKYLPSSDDEKSKTSNYDVSFNFF